MLQQSVQILSPIHTQGLHSHARAHTNKQLQRSSISRESQSPMMLSSCSHPLLNQSSSPSTFSSEDEVTSSSGGSTHVPSEDPEVDCGIVLRNESVLQNSDAMRDPKNFPPPWGNLALLCLAPTRRRIGVGSKSPTTEADRDSDKKHSPPRNQLEYVTPDEYVNVSNLFSGDFVLSSV
jgi:hypothetical protein